MKLPNGDRAIVEDQKLTEYLLSPFHREGKKHAELFRRLLDLEQANADRLRSALLDAARDGDAFAGKPSGYGTKYEIRFSMTGPRGRYIILSVWMIRHGEVDPRLVTAYVE